MNEIRYVSFSFSRFEIRDCDTFVKGQSTRAKRSIVVTSQLGPTDHLQQEKP